MVSPVDSSENVNRTHCALSEVPWVSRSVSASSMLWYLFSTTSGSSQEAAQLFANLWTVRLDCLIRPDGVFDSFPALALHWSSESSSSATSDKVSPSSGESTSARAAAHRAARRHLTFSDFGIELRFTQSENQNSRIPEK